MMEQKKVDYIVTLLLRELEMLELQEFPCMEKEEYPEAIQEQRDLIAEVEELGKYGHVQDLDDYDTPSGRRMVHHCQGELYDPMNNYMFSYAEYGAGTSQWHTPNGRNNCDYCIYCGKKLPKLDKRGRPIYD